MRAPKALGAPLALALFVAAATACGGDGGETGPSYGPPANVSKQPNTDNQTATVGTSVPIPPSVVVRDASGNAVPGATVTFTVTAGGGSVTGATPSTNAQGVATLGNWTLGTTAGPNQLTATVSGVSAVTFAATGTAGPPSAIAKVSGDAQTVKAGTAVPVPPSVRVQDQHGNPVSGAQITFAVTAGGGTVTGATQTTDANGRAAVASWTLGVSPGVNRLSVSVSGGVPTVEFSAQGLDPCGIAEDLPVGSSKSESLSTVDCRLEEFYVDFYATAIPAASAIQFTMTSATVDTFLELLSNAGALVAFNDDRPGTTNAGIKALLAAGTYVLGASSAFGSQTGSYSVSAQSTTASIERCEEVWATKAITSAQSLATTDCVDNSGPYYYDLVGIVLTAGQTVTITMTSTAFDAILALYDLDGNVVATDDDSAGGSNARIVFTATAADIFVIEAGSFAPSSTGAYTISIQ